MTIYDIGGETMELNIKAELARRNIQYKDMAPVIGVSKDAFYRKLRANKFTMKEFSLIAKTLGLKIVIEPA